MKLTDDMQRVVLEQRLGFHATVCPDGTPNLSPKGTTSVYDDEHLFFAEIRSPRTIENLRANPAIEVNVVDPIVRKGYRFKGTATLHDGDDVHRRALELLRERDYGDYEERLRLIVLIRVERAEPLPRRPTTLATPRKSWRRSTSSTTACCMAERGPGAVRRAERPGRLVARLRSRGSARRCARRDRDDAAAEPGAGQPCAVCSCGLEQLGERVELRRRDRVVVAQARVALAHQLPDAYGVRRARAPRRSAPHGCSQ